MNTHKIFVIDDEQGVLNAINSILIDYNVFIETNPYNALERLKEEKFQIIIVDYQIPVINGLEILEEIKWMYENRKPYICILATASGTTYLFKKEFENKLFTYFLEKPIDADKLRHLIQKSMTLLYMKNNVPLHQ